jgi:hypothetical protein
MVGLSSLAGPVCCNHASAPVTPGQRRVTRALSSAAQFGSRRARSLSIRSGWSATAAWRRDHHRVLAAWRAGRTDATGGDLVRPKAPAGAPVEQPRVVRRPCGSSEYECGRHRDRHGPGRWTGDPQHIQAHVARPPRQYRRVSSDQLALVRDRADKVEPAGHPPAGTQSVPGTRSASQSPHRILAVSGICDKRHSAHTARPARWLASCSPSRRPPGVACHQDQQCRANTARSGGRCRGSTGPVLAASAGAGPHRCP